MRHEGGGWQHTLKATNVHGLWRAFVVGWLTAQQETQSRACAAALRAFREAPVCGSPD